MNACRKLFHWWEQSLEMCDLYSAAPNAFVLLRSCISSASLPLLLSLFPPLLLPSDALPLPAATHLVHLDLSRPTTLGASLPDFLLLLAFSQSHLSPQSFHFLSRCPLVSTCVGVRPQPWTNDKAVLIYMWGATFPRILLFLSKVVIKL